jgi:hypothetical protein
MVRMSCFIPDCPSIRCAFPALLHTTLLTTCDNAGRSIVCVCAEVARCVTTGLWPACSLLACVTDSLPDLFARLPPARRSSRPGSSFLCFSLPHLLFPSLAMGLLSMLKLLKKSSKELRILLLGLDNSGTYNTTHREENTQREGNMAAHGNRAMEESHRGSRKRQRTKTLKLTLKKIGLQMIVSSLVFHRSALQARPPLSRSSVRRRSGKNQQ